MKPFVFNTVASLEFGPGALAKLGPLAKARLGARVLIVTDTGMQATGIVGRAAALMREAGVAAAVFDEVAADPPTACILKAAAAAKNFGATGVLGLGGGSSLDTAKLAALLAPGTEQLSGAFGVGKAKGPRLPLILIPTTAGTGSEVTPIAIVTTGENEKMGVVSPLLIPDVALIDPELTLGLPPGVTAATGIDAIVHAIESYASANANNNPISRLSACEALRLLVGAIETATHDGADLAARSDMLLGAVLAGQAFTNSPVAAVHALAYPLGGHYHIPHGLSNALMLAHVLRFNAETSPGPYAEIAPHGFPALAKLDPPARALAFCDELQALSARCGLPQRLREVGVPEAVLPMLARDAMKQTRLLPNNPRPLTEADALAIYSRAW